MMNKKINSKKIALGITMFLLVVIGSGLIYGYSMLKKVNTMKITDDKQELGISNTDDTELPKDKIINVALFGIDSRTTKDKGRSDAMMVLTIDLKNNKIKLSSLMRDSYVPIDGYGETKLNHAYAYDGPLLAIKTINQNFGTDIKDFASVNFESVIDIVDYFGGVEIDVKPEEVEYINYYQGEVSELTGKPIQTLEKSGKVKLTGMQALSYSRIRSTSNGDFERTHRQRVVFETLYKQLLTSNPLQLSGILSKILPHVTTSLDTNEIINLGTALLKNKSSIEQERFPVDGYCEPLIKDNIWYLKFDRVKTKSQITDYIYKDIKPEHLQPLF